MDPASDEIDPSWWEDALKTSTDNQYDSPETMALHFDRTASEAEAESFEQMVLQTMSSACSAILKPGNWSEPFTPWFDGGGTRSELPKDLRPDQIALLSRVAPLVTRDSLRARIADVAWVYGNRSDVSLLDLAIDAYSAVPLSDEAWFGPGQDSWIRAFELLKRRGRDGRDRMLAMSRAMEERVTACTPADGFLSVQLALTLREHGRGDNAVRQRVSAALTSLAAQASASNSRLSRHLERESLAWQPQASPEIKNDTTLRIARTYITEADIRIKIDPSAAMVEGIFLEKAIAILRTLDRAYRAVHEIEDLISSLRARLEDSREATLEGMARISFDPIDLTEAAQQSRRRVSGKPNLGDALIAFAELAPPIDEESTRTEAAERAAGSISRLFERTTFASDGRKVASSPGSTDGFDEVTVFDEMTRTVNFHAELVGMGAIWPALEVLTTEHLVTRGHMLSLCHESLTVPGGHEILWATGLQLGFDGEFGAAVSVLVPQLEQAVRIMLKRHGTYTLHVDDRGVETEKSLNALLDMDETAKIFGLGLTLELKSMLVTQSGPNLRNDIAHGLFSDADSFKYSTLYMWWFCFRLVMLPVIQMIKPAESATPEGPNDENPQA